MKIFNVKGLFCTETNKILEFTIGNKNNLSHKRKVEFKNLQKQIKNEGEK